VTTDARLVDKGVEAGDRHHRRPSGIPGIDLVGTSITAAMASTTSSPSKARSGCSGPTARLKGKVEVAYENNEWAFDGEATVANLIPGIDPFTVSAHFRGEEKWLKVDHVEIKEKKLGGSRSRAASPTSTTT